MFLAQDYGRHNAEIDAGIRRLDKSGVYKDLSTIIIVPALKSVPTKVVASWLNLMSPPNQKVFRIFSVGMEVGAAYSQAIENILAHPDLSKFRYILTLEHDNVPPPDGLLKLLEAAEERPEFSTIGGLYWTKGEGGVPQIWGNPNEHPLNFRPQPPRPGELVECCGTGMGFTLFRLDMFKDERLRKPWFETKADTTSGVFTQDLWFWQDARKHGFRAAIDCRVMVGHYDATTDITW